MLNGSELDHGEGLKVVWVFSTAEHAFKIRIEQIIDKKTSFIILSLLKD